MKEAILDDIKARLECDPPTIDGYQIYQNNYPAPTFLFDGLLANGITIVAGRPKCGKSWLVLQMALDAAMNRPFLGRFDIEHAARVLYCGLEEPQQRTNNRLKKLLHEVDVGLKNIQFRYTLNSLVSGGVEQLDKSLRENPSELLIIDTLLAVARADGRRDVMRAEYAEISLLRQLAEHHKNAIVLVAHTRKMSADTGLDAVAGTTGITAACDAVWALKKLPGGDCTLEMTGRETEERTLGLRFTNGDPFGWILTGEGVEVGMSEQRQEIVELLRDEAPLSPASVAQRLRKNAVTTRRLLQKLLADGVVLADSAHRYYLASHREQRERVNE